eukprot:c14084_g1_i2.p1 GENE.c14084_g1_i2~~c14084_g1_i2.p1  ORF type:complete len:205 (+),score=32.13 c14084_g1_i2:380-994(+)
MENEVEAVALSVVIRKFLTKRKDNLTLLHATKARPTREQRRSARLSGSPIKVIVDAQGNVAVKQTATASAAPSAAVVQKAKVASEKSAPPQSPRLATAAAAAPAGGSVEAAWSQAAAASMSELIVAEAESEAESILMSARKTADAMRADKTAEINAYRTKVLGKLLEFRRILTERYDEKEFDALIAAVDSSRLVVDAAEAAPRA